MNKIKLLLSASLLFISLQSQAQVRVGAGAGLISDGSVAALQGRVEIGPSNFRMATSFNFLLEDGLDWAIDVDGHYLVGEVNESIDIVAFPGINLLKIGVGNGSTEIGLNLGAGIRIRTSSNTIYIEPKYTINSYDSFVITGGFLF